jgi:flagellar FliJ protein
MNEKLLGLLIERALRQRDDTARQLAQARQEHEAAHRVLGTLNDYRTQSLERGPVRSQLATDTQRLAIAGQFDARLVAAIEQQTAQTEVRARSVDDRQQDAASAYQRLKALEAIAQRRQHRALAATAKREQRLLDEFATDQAARRHEEKSR